MRIIWFDFYMCDKTLFHFYGNNLLEINFNFDVEYSVKEENEVMMLPLMQILMHLLETRNNI